MLKGGESGEPAIVPSKPAESRLVELITPHAGKAEMPQNKPPLAESEIAVIAQWIAQARRTTRPRTWEGGMMRSTRPSTPGCR